MRKLCHSALRRHVPSCLHNPPHATLTIADLIMRKLCHSALRRHVPSCLHNPPLRTTSTFYHFRKFTRLCSAKSTFDLLRDLVYLCYATRHPRTAPLHSSLVLQFCALLY